MYKKILAVLLAAAMLCSFAACGAAEKPQNQGAGHIQDGIVLEGSSKDSMVALGTPATQLDPQAVYAKITYTPQMFYGDYGILEHDGAEEQFAAQSSFVTWTRDGEETEFTAVPFRIQAGKHTLDHMISYVEEYNWMRAYFMKRVAEDEWYLDTVLCAYSVEGNKLVLKPLDAFEVDKENNKITYAFADAVWEYEFAFSGRNLTLKNGADTVTLTTGLDAYRTVDYLYVDNYVSEGSKTVDGIDYIRFRYDSKDNSSTLSFDLVDGNRSFNSIAVLQDNGLFTFTLALEESVKTYQYVYFYAHDDGITLTDGNEVYYYNDDYNDRNKSSISKYLTEEQSAMLEDMSESQLEQIAEKSANLLEDLAAAYQQAGLNVHINTQTGEIALDSAVLFGKNESAVSAAGQEFLQKFIDVYTSVVFDQKYDGFVSQIMVEGHTDTNGDYDFNKQLSEDRANSVKDYCLSAECGVDAAYSQALQTMLKAVGYSYDKPIYHENGEVDMDASRRVSFRFIINLDA